MKYTVKGIYKFETIVDTNHPYFERRKLDSPHKLDKDIAVDIAESELGDQLFDDDGHCSFSPSYLNWEVS